MQSNIPLAERLRPQSADQYIGQSHLMGEGGVIRRMIESGNVPSFILWGPPGVGKTTLAQLVAAATGRRFFTLSARNSGVKDVREVLERAASERFFNTPSPLLFIDEIHRFNKSQQDSLLSAVERGVVTLIGATTENPSFELNSALLSRCKVFVLKPLSTDALGLLAQRAEKIMMKPLPLTPEAREKLTGLADGDGRYFINLMETVFQLARPGETLDVEAMLNVVQQRSPIYDKDREGHYNLISALHKSLRGSDCDAALYWMARMIAGGEDPLYILRRLTRFAVEDVGLADPMALQMSIAAWDAYERLGSPEGDLAITNLVIFLATCPKSNGAYKAHSAAAKAAMQYSSLTPPAHILNAPTQLMKDLGYKKGYMYDHDTADGFSGQDYFPEKMGRKQFYHPVERGFEREISRRLAYWQKLRDELKDKYKP